MTQSTFEEAQAMENTTRAIDAGAFDLGPARMAADDSPFENAMACRLEFCSFGTARKGIMGEITTGADKDLLRLGKSIVVSEHLDAIKSADGEIRRWLENRSVQAPLFRSGTRLVKWDMFEEVDARLVAYITAERPRLVDAFLEDWPRAVDDAKRRLGPQWQEKNYPTERKVRQAFSAQRNWLEIGAPKALAKLDADRYARAGAELKEAFTEAMQAARLDVQVRLRDLVGRLAERLTPAEGATEKRKVFRDSAVENVREAFELFNGCDLTNDTQTRAIVDRGLKLIAGVTAEDLRGANDKAREDFGRSFAELTRELETLIVSAPSRAYGEDY